MLNYSYGNDLTPEFRARWRGMTDFQGGAKTFTPNKPQALFAKAVGEKVLEGTRVFLATSANGTGKTTAVINILLNIIYPGYNIYTNASYNDYEAIADPETLKARREVYESEIIRYREPRTFNRDGLYIDESLRNLELPGFFNYPLYHNFPKAWPKKIWYVSNADSLRFIHEELKKWAPPHSFYEGEWMETKDGKTYVSRVEFPEKGWTIYYKTIDQDPTTFETANISIIIFDEPPPRNLYKAAVYRIRAGGFIMIPATPLFGAAWFVDDIVDKSKELSKYHYHQTVNVWENCIETAGEWDLGYYGRQRIGNLNKSVIDFQIQETDPDEVEARVYGLFQHLIGLIFKIYKPELMFTELEPRLRAQNYMYRFVLDPHDRKPPAASWYALDWYGRITKIREFPSVTQDACFHGQRFVDIKDSGKHTVKDFCRMWLEIEQELQIPPSRIQDVIDPNFGNKKNSVSGLLIYEEYEKAMKEVAAKAGSERRYRFVRNVVDDLKAGHKMVKEMLTMLNTGDMPYLIDERCVNTDLAYRRYKYKEQTEKQLEEMGLSDIVEEKWKDFIDNDRYCFMLPWKWRPLPDYPRREVKDYGGTRSQSWKEKIRRPKGADGV